MAPYLMLYTMATYLIGNLVVLNASRGAILTGFGLLILHNDLPQFTWLKFLVLALVIIVLIFLNIKSFNADRSQQLKSATGIVLMAIPMQVILVFFLSISTTLFYHIPQTLMGSHPEQHPIEDSFDYWRNVEDDKRIAFLLRDSNIENKQLLSRQTVLADQETITTRHNAFNRKDQLSFRDNQLFLRDENRGTVWEFSHDEMWLQGSANFTGEVIGWLGQQGFNEQFKSITAADRFINVPSMVKGQFIVTDKTILQVDFANKLLSVKLMMTAEEILVGRPEFKKHFIALVTNKHTYLFNPKIFSQELELAVPSYQLPHPVALGNLASIESYRMADGFLLTYHGQNYYGFDQPGAEIFYAHTNGELEKIHSTRFKNHSFPIYIRHFDYLISPAIFKLRELISKSFQPSESDTHSSNVALIRRWSNTILITIILAQLSAALIVLFISRRILLSLSKTGLWLLMTLLIGVPALLSFLLLNNLRNKVLDKEVVNSSKDIMPSPEPSVNQESDLESGSVSNLKSSK
jgi:hypothetical protein